MKTRTKVISASPGRFATPLIATAIFLTACNLGCSSRKQVELETGTGTIQLDGQPLEGAFVEFQPENGSPSYGVTDASGKYSLRFSRDEAGVMPGNHTVRIRTARSVTDDAGNEQRLPERLPPRYHDQSELTAVVDGENKSFDFHLTLNKK